MSNDPNPNPTPTGPQGDPNPADQDPAKTGDQGKAPEGDPDPKTGDQAAELTAEKSAREAAEKRAADAEAEVSRLRRSNAAQKGTDVNAIRAEVREEFASQLVRAEVRAAAAGRLRDPADALALVDLSALAGQNGTVDQAAVTAVLDKLVKDKPYLAADSAEAPKWGDVGAGPRGTAEPEPASPYDRLRRVQRNN